MKFVLVLVGVVVGVPVLVIGAFWLYLTVHPKDVTTEEITPWCRLRRADPSVNWPHLLMSAPFEDEVLVRVNGAWSSAVLDRRYTGSKHMGAFGLGGGEAVLAGFGSDWKLFGRGRAIPILADGWTKEGECEPVPAPSGASFLCLRIATRDDSSGRTVETIYRLQSYDVAGRRTQDLRLALPEPAPPFGVLGGWHWKIHGFGSDGAPIFMQRVDRGSSYTCSFARLDGDRMHAAGEASCELSTSFAPPGLESTPARRLP